MLAGMNDFALAKSGKKFLLKSAFPVTNQRDGSRNTFSSLAQSLGADQKLIQQIVSVETFPN